MIRYYYQAFALYIIALFLVLSILFGASLINADASCIGHECGGPYIMPEPQPLVLQVERGAARDSMTIVIKPLR